MQGGNSIPWQQGMIAAPPPYVGGDLVHYNYHQELQSQSMMPVPMMPVREAQPHGAGAASRGISWPHVGGGGGKVEGGGDGGSGGDQSQTGNNFQSPPVEEVNAIQPPATFGEWVKKRTLEWSKESDVFGMFFATPKEIEAYAYHERLLVILHIVLITLFCSSFMSSIFACSIHRGYASVATKFLVAALLVPMLKTIMGTWLIKMIFQRGKQQKYWCLTVISTVAHFFAASMLVTTGFLAFVGLYMGPTKDDPCGGWVWGGTEVADLAYLFVNWLFSVSVVDWAVALVMPLFLHFFCPKPIGDLLTPDLHDVHLRRDLPGGANAQGKV